ncbi:MAG: sugar transferase [Thermoanaerobaculia bacterium]|nr:sugar transferase [Thermoanaerobaculia bacterium]
MRVFDVIATGIGLVVLSPLLLILGLLVALSMGRPILFRQSRVGRHGKLFQMIKFRSMRAGAGPQVTSANDPRVTRLGRFFRQWKLDELPELWNVLVGDMSLVGPRPEVPDYVDLTDERWQRVLSVRPGITDPVTIWLRNEEELLSRSDTPEIYYRDELLPRKLVGYIDYLDHRRWWTDLGVLVTSVWRILVPVKVSETPG